MRFFTSGESSAMVCRIPERKKLDRTQNRIFPRNKSNPAAAFSLHNLQFVFRRSNRNGAHERGLLSSWEYRPFPEATFDTSPNRWLFRRRSEQKKLLASPQGLHHQPESSAMARRPVRRAIVLAFFAALSQRSPHLQSLPGYWENHSAKGV